MTSEKLKQQLRRLILHQEAQKYTVAKLDGSEVKYPHQSDYLTDSNLDSAISGVSTGSQCTLSTIGIMLAQDKTGLTKAGCIDMDVPRDAENMTAAYALAQRLQETAKNCGLNSYIEYSGSRGYHLWIFSKTTVTASLMQSCLRAIALEADFEALEIFPHAIPESKCIKLPSAVHLKSSKRCGFIDGRFNPLAPSVSLDNQASLMADFKQNTAEAISKRSASRCAKLANLESPNQNQAKSKNRFNSFGDSQPSCINYLIAKGAPLDLDYNLANVTLARYCLERGYDLSKSTKLASQMAKNTPESHPTKKDYQGKIKNFRGAFKSAYRKGYEFSCSYALARLGDKPLASRGCIGTQCPACDWSSNGKSPVTRTKMPYNRLIFQAIGNLSSEGKECCKSAIMCAAVIAISDINKAAYQSAVAGGELDMGALRDSFKIAHSADVIQLLQSGVVITGKGESKTKLDQLQLLAHKYPEKQRVIDRIRENHPINNNTADTYSRLTIVKNRGGKLGEPVFKYSRALHDFVPLDFQVEINPDSEDI